MLAMLPANQLALTLPVCYICGWWRRLNSLWGDSSMTAEDRFVIQGRLAEELEQAEEDFACLRESALQAAVLLQREAGREPSGEDFEPLSAVGLTPTDSLSTLIADLRKARKQVQELRQRRSLMSRRSAVNTL